MTTIIFIHPNEYCMLNTILHSLSSAKVMHLTVNALLQVNCDVYMCDEIAGTCKDRCWGMVLRLGLPSSIAAGHEACCGQGDVGEVGSEDEGEEQARSRQGAE
jgi:hypothetical protein